MNTVNIIILGLALAMDATIYAFSYGLVLRKSRWSASLALALVVGAYQAAMPILGYLGGVEVAHLVQAVAPWIVLAVFCALGGNVIYQAWFGKGDEEENCKNTDKPLGFSALMMVGIATAIDALAVGVCMALPQSGGRALSFGEAAYAAALIGVITFACAFASFHSAKLLHRLPCRWLETAAGLILIGLGVQAILY